MTQTTANLILFWLCVLQPALALGAGVLIGRYGFRRALTNVLVKIFGTPPPEPGN